MNIEPIEDVYGGKPAVKMYITASDSWGNPEQNQDPSYEAIVLLVDEDNTPKKRLKLTLEGTEYSDWNGSNEVILDLILNKYSFLKIKK